MRYIGYRQFVSRSKYLRIRGIQGILLRCFKSGMQLMRDSGQPFQTVQACERADIRWDWLSDVAKGPKVWAALARNVGPLALRMNLSTLLRHDVFSVEQLSSTVSEAGTNFTSDKRLGQSFYNMVDYMADRIADESEIRRGNSSCTSTLLRT
jgi:hypothetical protein